MTESNPGRRRIATAALLVVAVVGGAACGNLWDDLANTDQRPPGPGTSHEGQEALLDDYLTALRDGDVEAAWELVCDGEMATPDRDAFFELHSSDRPRPVSWTFEEPGHGPFSNSWPQAHVTFDDGVSGFAGIDFRNGWVCGFAAPDSQEETVARLDVPKS